jgi:site-specific DNA-methyltransferase (adenine-specific)
MITERANIQLFNMDCMEAMAKMPDKAFDLAIVDVPYGIDAASDVRGNTQYGNAKAISKSYGAKDWDKSKPTGDYFKELFRVSENQIIWGANHLGDMPPSPCWVVWDKDNGDNGYADCELAWASFSSAVRKIKYTWHGMIQQHMGKNKEIRIHPTQKPVSLYKWLLQNYAKQGNKILDTHLGSGSIAIACWDMGFDLTGYEIDTDYFNDAVARLERHKAQGQLF